MSKATKIWLIVAASLVLLGTIIFAGVMALLKWDFLKLTTRNYETNTYEISEDFNSVSINTDTADIVFVASDDEKCKVVCYEEEKMKHSVGVVDGKLSVNTVNTKKWYDYINIGWSGNPMITVYLPKDTNISLSLKNSTGDVSLPKELSFESIDIWGSTGDVKCYASSDGVVKIRRSTGDILLEGVCAGELELSVSTGHITATSINCAGDVKFSAGTGDIKLDGINCKALLSKGDTSDIFLKDVIASERFDIETDTGKVSFDRCDAGEISVKTDTGRVTGTLLSDKVFFTKADTGDVDVPRTTSGGKCEIETDTGDIRISIVN